MIRRLPEAKKDLKYPPGYVIIYCTEAGTVHEHNTLLPRKVMHELRKWQMMQSIEEGSPPPELYQWDGEYSRRRR